ncbi:MAG: hypothetical protein GC179_07710 [Anaerolineaceae bacterium]|nr:hypothetical protein [Anaerolineaceae bacterium]
MQPLEAAILRTVLYADVFDFPMKLEEIHHFLISDTPSSVNEISQTLDQSIILRQKIHQAGEYFIYKGGENRIQVRQKREAASQYLWSQALYWGKWLAAVPYVRMVALTGALAVRNAADDDDDLDYLLVTAPHRVWIARAFAIVIVRIGRLRGVTICPNYVLAETNLVQVRRDIFLAHEVAQMVPLYGRDHYRRFREANDWVYQQLPNAIDPYFDVPELKVGSSYLFKRFLEVVCGGTVGNWIEQWEYQRKLKRFSADLQTPHSSAKVDDTQVKGHFNDHGHPVLQKYAQRLRECGLSEEPLAMTGD